MVEIREPTAFSVISRDIRAWLPVNGMTAFAGAWGVINGFALFVVVEEKLHEWWIPVGAVILATIAAAVTEWLRGSAAGHRVEKPTLARAISFFVLLGAFELFIYAFHDLIKEGAKWVHVLDDAFGAHSLEGYLKLAVFIGLWVLIAARLGAALSTAVRKMPYLKTSEELAAQLGQTYSPSMERLHGRLVMNESLLVGLKIGLKVGLFSIPLLVLTYTLLVRLVWATLAYWFDGSGEWRLPGESWFGYFMVLLIVGAVAEGIAERRFGVAMAVAAYFAVAIFYNYFKGGAEAMDAIGKELWDVGRLAADIAIIWLPPSILLSVFAPFLRRPSLYPWLWAPLALAAAACAVVLVLIQQEIGLLVAAALLGFAGLVLRSGGDFDELWPVFAASVATVAALATALVLQATPLSAYRTIAAGVVPPTIGTYEFQKMAPRLAEIDDETCPAARQRKYLELKDWVMNFEVARFQTLYRRNEMRDFVEERRRLDAAISAGASAECDHEAGANAAKPATAGADPHHAEEETVPRSTRFSLAMISSVSFWLTLGLLVAWQIRRTREKPGPHG